MKKIKYAHSKKKAKYAEQEEIQDKKFKIVCCCCFKSLMRSKGIQIE